MKISFKHDYHNLELLNSMWSALLKECSSLSMTAIEEDDEIFTKRIHEVLRIKL